MIYGASVGLSLERLPIDRCRLRVIRWGGTELRAEWQGRGSRGSRYRCNALSGDRGGGSGLFPLLAFDSGRLIVKLEWMTACWSRTYLNPGKYCLFYGTSG